MDCSNQHSRCSISTHPECDIIATISRRIRTFALHINGIAQTHLQIRGTTIVHPASTTNQSSQDLPRQLTSFIGREVELAELKRLLGERRLITLTGAGGSGKTRLALELCASLTTEYIGDVFIVELAPISKAELVVETIRRVLGVEETLNQPPLETLAIFLRNRRSLLVLDNC